MARQGLNWWRCTQIETFQIEKHLSQKCFYPVLFYATLFCRFRLTLAQIKTWGGWKSNNVLMECTRISSSMKMHAAQRLEIVEDEFCEKQSIEDINACTQSPELSFTTTTFNRNSKPVHGYIYVLKIELNQFQII